MVVVPAPSLPPPQQQLLQMMMQLLQVRAPLRESHGPMGSGWTALAGSHIDARP